LRLHVREFFASPPIRDKVRFWAYTRPFIGWFVPDKPYTPPPITVYIVKHPNLNAYLRNPRVHKYGPIWGSRPQACIFENKYMAEICLAEECLDGEIIAIQKAR
jgi:hypothetical protein